jgi:hypothetical protein
MGHQEGAREARKCAHQGGNPSQLRIQGSNFESNLKSSTTLPLN